MHRGIDFILHQKSQHKSQNVRFVCTHCEKEAERLKRSFVWHVGRAQLDMKMVEPRCVILPREDQSDSQTANATSTSVCHLEQSVPAEHATNDEFISDTMRPTPAVESDLKLAPASSDRSRSFIPSQAITLGVTDLSDLLAFEYVQYQAHTPNHDAEWMNLPLEESREMQSQHHESTQSSDEATYNSNGSTLTATTNRGRNTDGKVNLSPTPLTQVHDVDMRLKEASELIEAGVGELQEAVGKPD